MSPVKIIEKEEKGNNNDCTVDMTQKENDMLL